MSHLDILIMCIACVNRLTALHTLTNSCVKEYIKKKNSMKGRVFFFLHLYPQWFRGGTRWRQVLQVSCPLVREHRPSGFVLAVPLDGPAAIQEVLERVVASERKEIAWLGHLLDADIAGSFGNQADVDVACRTMVTVQLNTKRCLL